MVSSRLELDEFQTHLVPSPVPYAVLLPHRVKGRRQPLPLGLHLHGGSGSREELVVTQALYDSRWSRGGLPRIVVATTLDGSGVCALGDTDQDRNKKWRFVRVCWPRPRSAIGTERAGGSSSVQESVGHP